MNGSNEIKFHENNLCNDKSKEINNCDMMFFSDNVLQIWAMQEHKWSPETVEENGEIQDRIFHKFEPVVFLSIIN